MTSLASALTTSERPMIPFSLCELALWWVLGRIIGNATGFAVTCGDGVPSLDSG